MTNPLDALSYSAWITGFTVADVPEQMAQAYKDLYGKELTLSDGCANAGYEFLKRLHENEPMYMSSGDAICEKVRKIQSNGCKEMRIEPFDEKVIKAAESVLAKGGRVELIPVKGGGVKVVRVRREEVKK